jgi:hypothetical protein
MGQESETVRQAVVALSQSGMPLARIGLRHRSIFPASVAKGLAVRELDPECAGAREVEGVWDQLRDMLKVAAHARAHASALHGTEPTMHGGAGAPL